MISLKEAIKLTKLSGEDICYLRKEGTGRYDAEIIAVKDVRNKLDMKNTKVISITPRFSEFDYCGIEFGIK